MHSAKVLIRPCSLGDFTVNRPVHVKLLILDKGKAYLVFTVMVTSTKLKYFMSHDLQSARHLTLVLKHDEAALLNLIQGDIQSMIEQEVVSKG